MPGQPTIRPDQKQCTLCKEVKSRAEFYKTKWNRDGYFVHCKVCARRRLREQRVLRAKLNYRPPPPGFQKMCPFCKETKPAERFCRAIRESDGLQTYCKDCKSYFCRLKRYGLLLGEFEKILDSQGGRCAICNKDLDVDRRNRHLDHCHETGAIRGILCRGCNNGLGSFQDNPEILEKAAIYLRRNGK